MNESFCHLSAVEIAAAVRNRRVSPVKFTGAVLERVELAQSETQVRSAPSRWTRPWRRPKLPKGHSARFRSTSVPFPLVPNPLSRL
jgi:hypothetical protein